MKKRSYRFTIEILEKCDFWILFDPFRLNLEMLAIRRSHVVSDRTEGHIEGQVMGDLISNSN